MPGLVTRSTRETLDKILLSGVSYPIISKEVTYNLLVSIKGLGILNFAYNLEIIV